MGVSQRRVVLDYYILLMYIVSSRYESVTIIDLIHRNLRPKMDFINTSTLISYTLIYFINEIFEF